MASDFTLALQNNQPVKTVTSLGSSTWHRVIIPAEVIRISVGCELTDIYLSFSYEEGDTASLVDAVHIPKNNLFSQTIPHGLNEFFLVAKTGTASNVVVVMEVL